MNRMRKRGLDRPSCPACGLPGEMAGWRGLNLLFRCPACGKLFFEDRSKAEEIA